MHMKRIDTVREVLAAYTDHIKHEFWTPHSMQVELSHLDHGTTYTQRVTQSGP